MFLAVVAQAGAALADVRQAAAGVPLTERLAFNIAAGLDLIAAHRETWFAVMGHTTSGDDEIDGLSASVEDFSVERALELNGDVISDSPMTRAALRATFAVTTEVTRQWLRGELTREQAEILLLTVRRNVLTLAIPAMHAAGSAGAGDPV